MTWINNKGRSVPKLGLAVAAIAVPAWASSGGGGEVQRASEAAGAGASRVDLPPMTSGSDDRVPLDPAGRQQLDQAIQCMADRGFGGSQPGGGAFIPRSETRTDAVKRAASQCQLPPPPTDAQIRHFGCADARARGEARNRESG